MQIIKYYYWLSYIGREVSETIYWLEFFASNPKKVEGTGQ
jgi:hypothetical protein